MVASLGLAHKILHNEQNLFIFLQGSVLQRNYKSYSKSVFHA